MTVTTTVATLSLAVGVAVLLRLRGGWLGALVAGLGVVPLFIPVVIASWAILNFYAGDGFVRSLFAQVGIEAPTLGFTVTGVVIASIWVNLPFALADGDVGDAGRSARADRCRTRLRSVDARR